MTRKHHVRPTQDICKVIAGTSNLFLMWFFLSFISTLAHPTVRCWCILVFPPTRPPASKLTGGGSLFYHHFFFEGTVVGMQARAATTTILYDKVLRLSLGSLGQVRT